MASKPAPQKTPFLRFSEPARAPNKKTGTLAFTLALEKSISARVSPFSCRHTEDLIHRAAKPSFGHLKGGALARMAVLRSGGMAKGDPVCDIRFRQMSQAILWEDTIQAGASWSLRLRRGQELRIEDSEGGANVAALFYNYDCPTERYNMPDTLKAQHTAHLTKGFVLYSDMGRILCSITDDTRGWHDPLGGHNDATAVRQKYGDSTYQEMRNAWHRNTRDNFLVELGKYGLGLRDLTPNVNFFSKVVVENDGSMEYVSADRAAGDFVSLRAEMNLLVILDTGQHPLDPNPTYAPKPVKFSVQEALPAADDLCRVSRPENARGFINTARYFL